jgi:NTE family protein
MAIQIGLALSGGGARGIAHIGVLKVLAEAEAPVSLLAGTSMGGILCALYAAGRPVDEIEQLARTLRPLDVVQRGRTGLGLLGQDKIANWLRDVLGGDLTFDQLNLPLALIATDWETGDEVVIREGPVVDGLLATTALPGIFAPPLWRGRRVLDGALVNPVPFDVVRQMGADRVIAANTRAVLHSLQPAQASPRGRGMEPALRLLLARSNWTPMLHVLERSIGIMGEKLVEQRMRDAPPDLMIEVLLDGVGHFDFSKMDVCLAAGEEAARQRWSELIELRDAPAPGRWWQTLRQRLSGRVTRASK